MKIFVLSLLAVFALGSGQDCSGERAEACLEKLLESLLGDTDEDEVCGELQTSITCLRNAVDECMEEEDEEIEAGLKELEKTLSDNCEQGEVDEEDQVMKECFEANEDYIYECIYEGTTQALTAQIEKGGEFNENALKCSMYSFMADCFVERVGEKCGDEASTLVKTEMDDVPTEIAEACADAGVIDQHSFQLLDKKKK